MRRCLALFALPLLLGCGASARDLALVREDVTRLKHENQELTKRVGELEAGEATRKVEASAPVVTASAPAPAPAEGKPLKVVKLEPPKAPPSAPIAPEPVVEDDEPRPLLKIGPSGAIEQTLPDEATPKSKKKPSPPSLDPQAAKDYDAAYALVKAKKLQPALDALAGFLVRYPDHPYAANALYWRGECYWALGDYSSAATQFDALVARFPASGKTPDGLLKLGLAHRKLGSAGKAKVAFDRLRKEFPTSEAAKKIPPEDAS
ncbi:MAG: tol-pal system protein YbgF [Polyangiales bacterium]